MRDVGAIDHHAAEQHEFGERRAQQPEVPSELASIERDGFQHPPAEGRAGQVGVVIRIERHGLQGERRVRFEVLDRLRRAREEDLAQLAVEITGNRVTQIEPGLLERIGDSHSAHLRVGGDPHHAARDGSRAADTVRLLDEQRREPLGRRDARRGHAARAGADHDDIMVLGETHAPPPLDIPPFRRVAHPRRMLKPEPPWKHTKDSSNSSGKRQ